jgi:predicted XRE-type DNA-binding protein
VTKRFPEPFIYRDIVARIDAMIDRTGVKKKDVAAYLDILPSQFSDKRAGRCTWFTLDEINLLSRYFQERLGEPLPLWPLVSDEQARALAAFGVGRTRD